MDRRRGCVVANLEIPGKPTHGLIVGRSEKPPISYEGTLEKLRQVLNHKE